MSTFRHITELSKTVQRLSGSISQTPIVTNSIVDDIVGRNVYFKCENLQKTGSFRARGALNAVLKLTQRDRSSKGVCTYSRGNHGQALAWAAKIAGLPCSVVVPHTTPSVKCEGIKSYGADVFLCEPTAQCREEMCQQIARERNQTIIPTANHNDVINGQGTVAVEFLQQVPELDAILVPVSGGGLASGVAFAAKHIKPSIKIFGVEIQGKNLQASLQAGQKLWPEPPRFLETILDDMKSQSVVDLAFPLLYQHMELEVFSVTDDEALEAMKYAWQRMKIVIEVSSSLAISAVMSNKMKAMDPKIKNVGVVLGGGNVDLDNLLWYQEQLKQRHGQIH